MIYDIITIGIFVLFIILGVYKGAARMLIGLGVSFVSFIGASWLGRLAANGIYSAFISPAVHNTVSEAVQNIGNGAVKGISESLPWWLTGPLGVTQEGLSELITDSAGKLTAKAGDAVDAAVRPIISGVIAILLTIVFFLLIHFILRRLLVKPLLSLFKAPIINALNRTLGGFLGAVEGVLIVCMLAYALKLILPYVSSGTGFINESTIYNSFIFYHFYSGNIFTALSSWIQ